MQWAARYHAAELRRGMEDARDKAIQKLPPAKRAKLAAGYRGGAVPAQMFGAGTVPNNPFSAHLRVRFELLTTEYERKVKPQWDQFLVKFTAGMAELKHVLAQLRANGNCDRKAVEASLDKFFVLYSEGLAEWSTMRPLLANYWNEAESVLWQIADQPTFDYADQLRRVAVTGWASTIWHTLFFEGPIALQIGLIAVGSCETERAVLGHHAPQPSPVIPARACGLACGKPLTALVSEFSTEPGTKTPCPEFFSETKHLTILTLSVKASCDEAEVAIADGLAAGIKVSFATREIEVFVGAGGSVGLGLGTIDGRIGGTVTFQGGRVVDVGGRVDLGVTLLDQRTETTASLAIVAPAHFTESRSKGITFDLPPGL